MMPPQAKDKEKGRKKRRKRKEQRKKEIGKKCRMPGEKKKHNKQAKQYTNEKTSNK